MTVALSLGCKRYPWIEPLIEKEVEPTGIDVTVVDGHISPEYFTRMLHHEEFDMAELSLAGYFAAMEHSDRFDVTAIPVFPHRRFRHAFLYTQRGSEIETARDLNGKSIGLPNWQFTTGLWVRGILQERHGFDPASVEWKRSGSEIVPLDLSDDIDISDIQSGEDESGDGSVGGTLGLLEQMLGEGTLDAVITPTEFRSERTERLFSNAFDREREYYRETGIFPIMHVIVLQEELAADRPWIPGAMYDAFTKALRTWMEEVSEPGWFKRSPQVWGLESLEHQLELFDGNPWEYGLTDDNRTALRTALRYAHEQELVSDEYAIEDLFVTGVGDGA